MKQTLFLPALKAAIPLVLGALGGIFAATYPAWHAAFCGGHL